MKRFDMDTIKRLLKYMTENYKMQLILVIVCIIINTIATAARIIIFGNLNR